MRRGRSGGGLAALLQSAKAYFNGIMVKSSAYTQIVDESGTELGRIYKSGNGYKLTFAGAETTYVLIENSYIQIVQPTGYTLSNNSSNCSIGNLGGIGTAVQYILKGLRLTRSILSELCQMVMHINNSGSNSVIGYRYKIQATTGFVISVPADTINTLGLLVATEVVANGSLTTVMPLTALNDSNLVKLYFSTATTAGHYANFDGVNNGQFVDAVAPVANQCAGIIMETIGAAGLAMVLIQRQ